MNEKIEKLIESSNVEDKKMGLLLLFKELGDEQSFVSFFKGIVRDNWYMVILTKNYAIFRVPNGRFSVNRDKYGWAGDPSIDISDFS